MVKLKMMNRINKEVEMLEKYYGKDKVEVRTEFENEQHEYVINIYKNKHLFCKVKAILYHDYPFKDPAFCLYYLDKTDSKNIIIRTIKYFDFFTKSSAFYYTKKRVRLVDHLCPCCYHAMCNRQLNESLLKLSKDVQKFGRQFMRLRERYFVKKYLHDVNYLNTDSLNIILSYI